MPTEIPPRIAARARETFDKILLDQGDDGGGFFEGDSVWMLPLIAAALLACERETREADCAAVWTYHEKHDGACRHRRIEEAIRAAAEHHATYEGDMDEIRTLHPTRAMTVPEIEEAIAAEHHAQPEIVAPDGEPYGRSAGPNPNPGSEAAIAAGCSCPVIDNCHGRGFSYGGETCFWYAEDCQIHNRKRRTADAVAPDGEKGKP